MIHMRSFPLCALGSALLCSAAIAQSAAPAVRIVSPIDESQLVTLRGNVNPHANARNDRGPVSADFAMTGLTLVLSRSADQQAAFDAFVASQYDPSSPNFHQWLTPQQVGQRFGPAQADISTISGWLASHGFVVKGIAADHMSIQFSGTAGEVQNAFHTEIHNLNVRGAAHIANMTDPQIPAALAPVVLGIKGLHNFLPHPLHRMGNKVQFNPDTHRWVKLQNLGGTGFTAAVSRAQTSAAAASSTSSPKPNFYYPVPDGGGTVEEDVAPYDFAKIYNLPSGWPTSTNGSGQIITVIGTSDIDATDVSNFKSAFGLPAGTAPVIAHGPDGDPGNCGNNPATDICNDGDLDENSLDVEWSGAVAPGAQIVLVTDKYNSQTDPTNDPIFDGAQWAVQNASVQGSAVYGSHILSVSYGECELENGTASNVAYNNLWETAASAGIAVFVATGDSGSPACDLGGDVEDGNPYEAQYGLSVSGQASSPYDTAVGGTDFSWCQPTVASNGETINGCTTTSASTYWNTTNSSQQSSAKGYVPETPWNDTCENPINAAYLESVAVLVPVSGISTPEEACNFVYQDSLPLYFEEGGPALMYYVDTVGGSGGSSNCVVNNTDPTSTTVGTCSTGATSTGSTYGNLTLVNDGWPSPSWQAQSGVTGTSGLTQRAIPDVSFFAGDGSLDSATLICVSEDDASCTDVANTANGGSGEAEEIGGTSVATPEMAGVMALINQNTGASQGNPNAELYKLAGMQTYSSCSAESGSTSNVCYFNDIDQGTIAMPCAVSGQDIEGGAVYEDGEWAGTEQFGAQVSPNCSVVNPGDSIGTLTGYSAGTGYDQATGLGSLNVGNVMYAWPAIAVVPPASPGYAVNVKGPASVSSGSSATGTITVFTDNGYSGTVSLTCAPVSGQSGTVPTCSLSQSSVTLSSTNSSQQVTVTIAAAATSATLVRPSPVRSNGRDKEWLGAGGSAVLAVLVFFGIPARRRSWRAMLGTLVLLAFLGSMSACGGGSPSTSSSSSGSGGSGGGTGSSTAETYTFTVTATGSPAISGSQTQNFTVTVN